MDPEALKKLAAILQSSSKVAGPIGQALAPQSPQGQQGTPAHQGVAPPQMMTPPQIKFSTQGAGAAMPAPAPPPMPSFAHIPESQAMMSKLDPKGAATYSAIQGVSNILGQWSQKREAKQQAEAANIAQNLMQAIQSGDQGEIQAILNDPKATKVLNKVYKGWLTKAQDSQKPPEKQDPDVAAFEQGIAKSVQGGGGGGPQTGVKPSATGGVQSQQPQQEGMPRQVGGYMLPQTLPQELLRAATVNARLQQARNDPNTLLDSQMTSQQRAQSERIANMLEVSPKELAVLDASEQRAVIQAYAKIVTEQQKQSAITDRIFGMTGMQTASREKVAGMQTQSRERVAGIQTKSAEKRNAATNATRKEIAQIVSETAKDKASGKYNPDELTRKATEAQLRSVTSMLDNANSNYQRAVKEGNNDAATMFKQQVDMLEGQRGQINQDLEGLKSKSDDTFMEKMMQYITAGGDEPDASDDGSDDSN